MAGYPIQRITSLLEESQFWPRDCVEELRNEKVRDLIQICYHGVPYYHRVMKSRGLTPSDFTTVADLPKLPVLTKDIIRKNWLELQAKNIPDSRISTIRTSGTTGEPMVIRKNKWECVWERSSFVRGMSWGGLLPTMTSAKLFGGSLRGKHTKNWRDRIAAILRPRVLFLPAFELTQNNFMIYLDKIKRSRCRHLIGYSSAIYRLAIMAENAGESIELEAVFPTAEMLLASWRKKIADVLSCQVLPYYGCGEINSLGYSCPSGNGYHQCDEHAVMEVETNAGEYNFEGEGAFVITDLDNNATPLLRYQNGDGGVLSKKPCSCGRSLSQICRIDGRVRDMLVAVNGNMIHGGLGSIIFQHIEGVEFWQVVQDEPGQVLIRIVSNRQYNHAVSENRLSNLLRKYLGAEAKVEFEYPNDIERTPAGKAKFVINRYLARKS